MTDAARETRPSVAKTVRRIKSIAQHLDLAAAVCNVALVLLGTEVFGTRAVTSFLLLALSLKGMSAGSASEQVCGYFTFQVWWMTIRTIFSVARGWKRYLMIATTVLSLCFSSKLLAAAMNGFIFVTFRFIELLELFSMLLRVPKVVKRLRLERLQYMILVSLPFLATSLMFRKVPFLEPLGTVLQEVERVLYMQ